MKLVDLEVEIVLGTERAVIPGEYAGTERIIEELDFATFNKRDIDEDINDENFITVREWLDLRLDLDEYDYKHVVKVFKDVIMKGDLIYEDS